MDLLLLFQAALLGSFAVFLQPVYLFVLFVYVLVLSSKLLLRELHLCLEGGCERVHCTGCGWGPSATILLQYHAHCILQLVCVGHVHCGWAKHGRSPRRGW